MSGLRALRLAAFGLAWALAMVSAGRAAVRAPIAPAGASSSSPRLVQAAIDNIRTLERVGEDGYATIYDGDKYVQCRRLADGGLRCEAAGAMMQPSLARVLTQDRVDRLAALGWRLDPSFGNYTRQFPADAPTADVAAAIAQALTEGYGADMAALEVETSWIASEPCPPRNGPTQSLAGMVNDAPSMAAFAIHACEYLPEAQQTAISPVASVDGLVARYGRRVTAEIQRLRLNPRSEDFVAFDTGIGYVQCVPQTDPLSIYCEAESAESWPALSAVLTADRVAKLHAAGYADPGRAPNYSKTYVGGAYDDAAIARELLTLLHDVYGYEGVSELEVKTEADPSP